ncbi:hypothetical protein ACOME3_002673 [Neoechinorhynchus agilis]
MLKKDKDSTDTAQIGEENDPRFFNQLQQYAINHEPSELRANSGCPLVNIQFSLTAGPRGPIVLQDTVLIEQLSDFNRSLLAPRCCFAKGYGARGYFQCTSEKCSTFTTAIPLRKVDDITEVTVRFSKFFGSAGTPDTTRNLLGMSVKFFTENGNWDMICSSLPVFFINDPINFVSLCRSHESNPVTNLPDPEMKWDFLTQCPESLHLTLMLNSSRGIHYSYQCANYYSVNTYKLVDKMGQSILCRFTWKPQNGTRVLSDEDANKLVSQHPDFYTEELIKAITKSIPPKWTLYAQILNPTKNVPTFDPCDCTFVWPHEQYPLMECGILVLNSLPMDYHADVEQLCFSPNNLIDGVQPSQDKILQGRLFAYADAQRHRLGVNFRQLRCNRDRCPVGSMSRGGKLNFDNPNGMPNYIPNSFNGLHSKMKLLPKLPDYELLTGHCGRFASKSCNFQQVRAFYERVLDEDERKFLVKNLAEDICIVQFFLKKRILQILALISEDLSGRIKAILDQNFAPLRMSDKSV